MNGAGYHLMFLNQPRNCLIAKHVTLSASTSLHGVDPERCRRFRMTSLWVRLLLLHAKGRNGVDTILACELCGTQLITGLITGRMGTTYLLFVGKAREMAEKIVISAIIPCEITQ